MPPGARHLPGLCYILHKHHRRQRLRAVVSEVDSLLQLLLCQAAAPLRQAGCSPRCIRPCHPATQHRPALHDVCARGPRPLPHLRRLQRRGPPAVGRRPRDGRMRRRVACLLLRPSTGWQAVSQTECCTPPSPSPPLCSRTADCKVEHCASCQDNAQQCDWCDDGWWNDKAAGACTPCSGEHCVVCATDGDSGLEVCTDCEEGFEVDYDSPSQSCVPATARR